MNTNQEIADTIRQQLGGNRFQVMTGAKDFVYGERYLQFRISSRFATNGANLVRVKLEGNDTYTVTFYRLRGVDCRTLSTHEMIYADMLRDLFTRETGLDTHL